MGHFASNIPYPATPLAFALEPKGTLRLVLGTYLVSRFATLARGLRVPRGHDLVVGQNATVNGPILGGASVHLAKGVIVRGPVRADVDIVVGAEARVEGDVTAGGNVVLLDGARVRGRVKAGARAQILGGNVEGPVQALGDIEVGGASVLSEIHAGGRIRTLSATTG